PLNDVSAAAFVALLTHMAALPHARTFTGVLPVAGESPWFRRMGGTPAGGNLEAKTGTIDDVSALSGYVTAANGERIAFSIIGNDLASVGRAKAIENRIGAALAGFSRQAAPDRTAIHGTRAR
ncbi:MAG: D-alanyl-D-alanine carboxypeptidase, partial [Gemmatimonadota bacterium]